MTAALNRPATGTVTNHARKMFLKRRQSTAFWERIQPTATTEPTWRAAGREGERGHNQKQHRTEVLKRQRQCEELQDVQAFLIIEKIHIFKHLKIVTSGFI